MVGGAVMGGAAVVGDTEWMNLHFDLVSVIKNTPEAGRP